MLVNILDNILSQKSEPIERHLQPYCLDNYEEPMTYYFNNLTPTFYYSISQNKDLFLNSPCFLLRDGIWGIFNFFNEFKSPHKKEFILFIPSMFEFIIPDSWKENTALYSVKKSNKSTKDISHIVFTGGLAQENFKDDGSFLVFSNHSNDKIQKATLLTDLKDYHFDKNLTDIEIRNRSISYFFKEFHKCGKLDSDHYDVYQNADESYLIVNLNKDKILFYDEFFIHKLLSKGANIEGLDSNTNSTTIKTVQLSEFHHYEISQCSSKASQFKNALIDVKSFTKKVNYKSSNFILMSRQILKYKSQFDA